ncbi:MAG: hypothetical protein VB071_05890 [Lawsonibacter sp.]|nr:hypothetical protein [Lawsonibacter sp.]
MTTKTQEREALQKIQKIVAGLGESSYVGTAFEGCFDIAEQNIEYDAAFSLKGQLELAQEELKKQAEAHEADARRFAGQKKIEIEALKADLNAANSEISSLKAEVAAIQKPLEPAAISEELIADLATFSMAYVDRIRAALLQSAGQIAKDHTVVKLLHEYSIRKAAETEDYARTVRDVVSGGAEFHPSNNVLTHATSYRQILEDLLAEYFN